MEKIISKERLNIRIIYDFLNDADSVLDRINSMEWKGYNKRERKDYGNKGVSYKVIFGGNKCSTRNVIDWDNEPLLLSIRNKLSTLQDSDYCVIQRYKNGSIGMNKHKDNEMDDRLICGLSLGATRILVMYPPSFNKKDLEPIRIELPHNSLYVIENPTNKYWMHSIDQDKDVEKVRYSLTFRQSS